MSLLYGMLWFTKHLDSEIMMMMMMMMMMMVMVTVAYLLCTRPCAKHLKCIHLFNSHHTLAWAMLSSLQAPLPFCRRALRLREVNDSSKATQ